MTVTEPYPLVVEALFCGNVWVDITPDLHHNGIGIFHGRRSAGGNPQPGSLSFTLLNMHGRYTPDHPLSPYWPQVGLGTQIRARVGDDMRFWGEAWEWHPIWPEGDLSEVGYDQLENPDALLGEARVRVVVNGILRRISDDDAPLDSALRQHYLGGTLFGQLVAYLPLEDSPGTREAANLVQGQSRIRYLRGAPPEFPRLPGFGEDDTCPGSAPLPQWPTVDYFGWSRGASTAPPPLDDFVVQMAIRVPPDSGEAWLCEWLTTGGTRDRWELKVTPAGMLQLVNTGDVDISPTVVTYTSTRPVADDVWRPIQVAIRVVPPSAIGVWLWSDGVQSEFTTGSTTLGVLRAIRPRPMFADSEDKDPIGLGHVAVIARDNPMSTRLTGIQRIMAVVPPVDGHDGERAVDRFERVSVTAAVPYRSYRPMIGADEFDRTATDGWGEADHGGVWETFGLDSAFSVDNDEGRIVGSTTTTRRALLPPVHTDVDVRVLAGTSSTNAMMGVTGRAGDDFGYEALLDLDGGARLDLFLLYGGTYQTLAFRPVADSGDFTASDRWWIRLQCDGLTIRAKVWAEHDPEPDRWQLSVVDSTLPEGRVGVFADGLPFGPTPTIAFRHFTAGVQDSPRMGPQRPATLMDNYQSVVDVDGGILAERIDGMGLEYRSLGAVTNQDPVWTLDASGGEMVNPFTPVTDDRDIVNILTVQRVDGGEVFGSVDEGPRSTATPPDGAGPRRKQVTVSVETDEQLPGQLGWRLHEGTWPGARYPSVSPDLNESPQLHDLWTALRQGDRIQVDGLPPQHPPGPVDVVALGWAETITPYDWRSQVWAMPYGPYEVATVAATPGPGLVVNGQVGSYAWTPHVPELAITGDIDLRADATGDWSPEAGVIRALVAKFDLDVLAGQGQYWLSLNAVGQLRFGYSTTGSNFLFRVATALPYARASQAGRLAVRATFEADVNDDGTGPNITTFYTAPSIEGPWTQLGMPVSQSGAVTMFDGVAPLEAGARSQGTEQPWIGVIHSVEVRDGGGTLVANPRFDHQPVGTTEFDDDAGRTWMLGGDAVIDANIADARGQAVDTDRSTLADDITDTATVFEVVTDLTDPLSAPWTTDPTDWDATFHGGPLTITVGGEHMNIDNIAGEPAPATVRAVRIGSRFGSSYTVQAPPAAPNDLLLAFQTADLGSAESLSTPTGGGWQEAAVQSAEDRPSKVWWKTADTSEPSFYRFFQAGLADGVTVVVSVTDVDPDQLPPTVAASSQTGTGSTISTPSTAPGLLNLGLRFASANPSGSGVLLDAPPGFTPLGTFNQDGLVVAAGASRSNTGGTTGVHNFSTTTGTVGARHGFTVNVTASPAQTFAVTRGVNGFSKPHPAGTPVRVAYPARVAL